MIERLPDSRLPAAARRALEVLLSDDPGHRPRIGTLLAPVAVPGTAAGGSGAPRYEEARQRSYPARQALSSLAHRRETAATARRVGVTGARVLDLGCGPALVAEQLAQEGAAVVVGCDAQESMLRLAADLGAGVDVELVRADATEGLPFADDRFDLVWAQDCWPTGVDAEVARVLRPEGRVVRTTTLGHTQTFVDDPGLDRRTRAACERGLHAWRVRSRASAPDERRQRRCAAPPRRSPQPLWTVADRWTQQVERRQPISAVDAASRLQEVGLFTGALVADMADPRDWAAYARRWDPRDPLYVLRSPVAHLMSSLEHVVLHLRPTSP